MSREMFWRDFVERYEQEREEMVALAEDPVAWPDDLWAQLAALCASLYADLGDEPEED